jgi:hypothetical protein
MNLGRREHYETGISWPFLVFYLSNLLLPKKNTMRDVSREAMSS